jgi:hypothetical protein
MLRAIDCIVKFARDRSYEERSILELQLSAPARLEERFTSFYTQMEAIWGRARVINAIGDSTLCQEITKSTFVSAPLPELGAV